MTTVSTLERGRLRRPTLPIALRLALRELRGGLSGFYVFIICIALGVCAIAAIGTLSASLQSGMAREGRILLGGDVDASLIHRQAGDKERAFLASWGEVSEAAMLRAMARREDGMSQALIDLKAVDERYPLFGALMLEQDLAPAEAIHRSGGAAADAALLRQLGVKIGERITIGRASFPITAVIAAEPDRLAGGPGFGQRVIISLKSLQESGLNEPGSLTRWHYRIKLAGNGDAAGQAGPFETRLKEHLPQSGFTVRDRRNPSQGISRAIRRFAEFLTLAGLAALLVGGIGVANAVAAFIERKRNSIAVYKALGASRRVIVATYLLQVLMLAGLGIAAGLMAGILAPAAVISLYGGLLPVAVGHGLYLQPLLIAAAYGLLTALTFILWPLSRAGEVRAGELFREHVAETRRWPPKLYIAASALSAAGLAGAAILFSEDRWIATFTCAGLAAAFALFLGLGQAIKWLARRLPRPPRPEMALALANIGGPGGLTRTVTLSLGAGLTLLTAIALIDASLTAELQTGMPERAPSHFFIGIPKTDYERFSKLIAGKAPEAELSQAPMLRGRLVALAGKPVEEINAPPNAEWVLKGDRGLTFSKTLPEGAELIEGNWWPETYQGPPLVSFDAEMGKALGLKLGDSVTVNVLGRNVTAQLANFRTVKWETLGINFFMVFSPDTLAAAPYNIIATLNWRGEPNLEAEAAIMHALASEFPTVTAIRVGDVLKTIKDILSRVMLAIRAAAGLTLAAGAVVLAGALAAAQRKRIYEAVVLKALGVARRRIILAHLLEHLVLAAAAAAAAAALGAAAAYAILTQIMETPFTPSAFALLQAALFTTILMLAFGGLGALRVLRAKTAPYLRAE